jgi:hypothetical protein
MTLHIRPGQPEHYKGRNAGDSRADETGENGEQEEAASPVFGLCPTLI